MNNVIHVGGRGFGKQARQIKELVEINLELMEENVALKARVGRLQEDNSNYLKNITVRRQQSPVAPMFYTSDPNPAGLQPSVNFKEQDRINKKMLLNEIRLEEKITERSDCLAPGSCQCEYHVGFRQRIKAQQDREAFVKFMTEPSPLMATTDAWRQFFMHVPPATLDEFEAEPYPIPYLKNRKNNGIL